MNESRWDYLIQAHFDRTLTADEQREFEALMLESAAARARFWKLAEVHGLAGDAMRIACAEDAPSARRIHAFPARWHLAVAAAAVLVLCLAVWSNFRSETPAEALARFGPQEDCKWAGEAGDFQVGAVIRQPRMIELVSGRAVIFFDSGAETQLNGPCQFEVLTRNSGFLRRGTINARAAAQVKGFTVNTLAAKVVDSGTEFVASAGSDGQSRVDVTSGEVLIQLSGAKTTERLTEGDALSVEGGLAQIMVRIEKGDATKQFKFPSIEPPSSKDFADASNGRATVSVPRGVLAADSGVPGVLLDGAGQSALDAPKESTFFKNETTGMLMLDLGSAIQVSRVNSYSWHQNTANRLRAVQKYTLYGYAGDTAPSVEGPLAKNGWVFIARVNTDEFFKVTTQANRPAQQACSISSARGTLGRFRYLLLDVQPTLNEGSIFLNNTFFGEIDVYGEPAGSRN